MTKNAERIEQNTLDWWVQSEGFPKNATKRIHSTLNGKSPLEAFLINSKYLYAA